MGEKANEKKPWETKITKIGPDRISIRGYRIEELMDKCRFSEGVYLLLTGELPPPGTGRLMDMMMVSCLDHGVTPPSALAARTAASTGAPYNGAIAAGILSINEHHGGAIENAMRMLLALDEFLAGPGGESRSTPGPKREGPAIPEALQAFVGEYRKTRPRLPGFGHRIHRNDPRTVRLLAAAEQAGVAGRWVNLLKALAGAVEEVTGTKVPVNVDGALAALLLELGIAPELANSFFILSRVPGLAAHVHEEKTSCKPMRRIDPENHRYTGEPGRAVPPEI
jgi:citrate synthase/citryl-CoA lyase